MDQNNNKSTTIHGFDVPYLMSITPQKTQFVTYILKFGLLFDQETTKHCPLFIECNFC